MKKIFYITVFGLLMFSVVLMFLRLSTVKNTFKKTVGKLIYENSSLKIRLREISDYKVYEDIVIPKRINNILIDSLIKYSNINYLIMCFNEDNCGLCIKRLITDVNDFARKFRYSKVILIGDIPQEDLCVKLKIERINYMYIYLSELSELKKEYRKYPFIYVLNKNGIVKNLFIPDILQDYNEIYFNDILPSAIFD